MAACVTAVHQAPSTGTGAHQAHGDHLCSGWLGMVSSVSSLTCPYILILHSTLWTEALKKHPSMDVLLELSSSEIFVKNLHDSSPSVLFSMSSVEF